MNTIDLDSLVLTLGTHDSWEDGANLLEACSRAAGEPWSDRPACVSHILGGYGRALNNTLPDDLRQHLKRFIPRLLNTAGDGQDEARGLLALHWLITVYAPAWLRLVPELVADADRLAALSTSTTDEASNLIQEIAGRTKILADRARGAAPDRAVETAYYAAGEATANTAWPAGWAVGQAPKIFGWVTATNVAGDAARTAILTATGGDPLGPTVAAVQESAIDLLGMMINPSAATLYPRPAWHH